MGRAAEKVGRTLEDLEMALHEGLDKHQANVRALGAQVSCGQGPLLARRRSLCVPGVFLTACHPVVFPINFFPFGKEFLQ